jgi:hypothetical protein
VEVVAFRLEDAVFQSDVDGRVLDVFVAEKALNMEYVMCLVVFRGGFPMAKCMERYRFQSWVLKFERYLSSQAPQGCFAGSGVSARANAILFLIRKIIPGDASNIGHQVLITYLSLCATLKIVRRALPIGVGFSIGTSCSEPSLLSLFCFV